MKKGLFALEAQFKKEKPGRDAFEDPVFNRLSPSIWTMNLLLI